MIRYDINNNLLLEKVMCVILAVRIYKIRACKEWANKAFEQWIDTVLFVCSTSAGDNIPL